MPAINSILAASAAERGMTLVTRKMNDFDAAGIDLLDPWDYPNDSYPVELTDYSEIMSTG